MEDLLAGIIGAGISLVVAFYITPFRSRQNSEVSTLHSESVQREKLFNLAATPNKDMTAKNIELFRTFLSATRGIQTKSYAYNPNCRKSKGKDLDDLCLYFYSYLQKDLKAGASTISADKSQVLRQLCRLLLKSDWNTRIHPNDFEQTNNEILYKAILLINSQAYSMNVEKNITIRRLSLIDGKIILEPDGKQSEIEVKNQLLLGEDFKELLDSVIDNSSNKSYPYSESIKR